MVFTAGMFLILPITTRAQVAVIVNRANPMSSITVDGLRQMFLGRVSLFSDHLPIELAESPAVREAFDQAVLAMNEDHVKHEWIRLVFAGEGVAPPRAIDDADLLKAFVAHRRGAIAFVAAGSVDATVKIVRVNGLMPSDPGYPIQLSGSRERRP